MAYYDVLATEEAKRLGVHRTTLIAAIRAGKCGGEERDGRWYTSSAAAAEWYAQAYRLRDTLYSQASGKPWSDAEISTLRDLLAAGVPEAEIAAKLKRAPQAVRTKVSKLRAEGIVPPMAAVKAARKAARTDADREAEPPRQESRRRDDADRQAHKEGRVRLHLHPAVKAALAQAAEDAGITLTMYVTRAGMAAVADPTILALGEAEARKLAPDE